MKFRPLHDRVLVKRVEAEEKTITVSGKLAFNQTDFGITPYALLGGAIAVKDGLALRFRIQAKRLRG